jgi:hypothetical protein
MSAIEINANVFIFSLIYFRCPSPGEQPAAMQRSGSSLMMNAAGYWWRLSLVAVAMCYSSYSVGLLSLPMSVFVLVSLTTVPNLG